MSERNDPIYDLGRLLGRYQYLVLYVAVVTTIILALLLFGTD